MLSLVRVAAKQCLMFAGKDNDQLFGEGGNQDLAITEEMLLMVATAMM